MRPTGTDDSTSGDGQPLSDVAGPQLEAATVGYVATWAPSLVVASVAAHDGMDRATVQFLLPQTFVQEVGGSRADGVHVNNLLWYVGEWCQAKKELFERMAKRKRRKRRRMRTRRRTSCSFMISSTILLPCSEVLPEQYWRGGFWRSAGYGSPSSMVTQCLMQSFVWMLLVAILVVAEILTVCEYSFTCEKETCCIAPNSLVC